MRTNYTIKQAGFTLIELLVVAPLVILLIGVMIGYISAVTGDGLKSQQQNSLAYETQAALDDIDTTTAKAISFKGSTPTNPTTPQGPSDTAGSFTGSGNVLVLESIALTANSANDSRTPVYSEGTAPSCDTSSAPYTYYTVYFRTGNSLYKRTILPKTPVCTGAVPQQKNSCSPAIMQGSSAKGDCQVEDEKLTDNVTSFSIDYLNDADTIATLPNSTKINVKINTQKSVAGTTLTYAGSFRSKKQNNFTASTQNPQVTGNNIADPDKFNCNWDQTANATSYTFTSKIGTDAAVTSTESTGTGTKVIDVTTKRGQKLECQVTANLSNGSTLSYTSLVVDPIPIWTDPTLENNWIRYDNYYAGAGFTKTASGMIVLKGLIKSGTSPGRAFQLPANYRPAKSLLFQQSAAAVSGPSAAGRVDITADGSVYVQGTANGWVSLTGINFMPSQFQSSFTAATFSNGWTDYTPSSGDPNWLAAGYMQDSVGRLRVQGLIRAGTATDNTLAFSIPSNLRPAEYEHVAAHNSNAFGVIGNSPSDGIRAKGGGNTYLETNTLTYPASVNPGWTNLTLQNGWVRYPGYTTPKFTKGSDNLVMLKGLIQSGSLGYVFNIPGNLKLCPKERHIFAVASQGAYGRLDVEPGSATGGCGVSLQAGSNVWTSLDSVSWIGEI